MNTSVLSSGLAAIFFRRVHHVVVTNTSITESSIDGIAVFFSTNIIFSELSIMYIGKNYTGETQRSKYSFCNFPYCHGLNLMDTNIVFLYGVRVMHSTSGLMISWCVNITTINTTMTHVNRGITSFHSSKRYLQSSGRSSADIN